MVVMGQTATVVGGVLLSTVARVQGASCGNPAVGGVVLRLGDVAVQRRKHLIADENRDGDAWASHRGLTSPYGTHDCHCRRGGKGLSTAVGLRATLIVGAVGMAGSLAL